MQLIEHSEAGARRCWSDKTIHGGGPKRAWASDEGWSAVLCRDDTLLLLDPVGTRVARANVLELLREDPCSMGFIRNPSDDVFLWDSDPLGVFAITNYGAPCFVLRCYWRRRVLLHAGAPAGTMELSTVSESAILGRELALATALLTEALGRPETEGTPGRFCAAAIALGDGGSAAAELLRRVVALPVADWDFAGSIDDVRTPSGALDSLWYAWNLLPVLCTWALVRLGERPPRRVGYGFCWDDFGDDDDDDELSYGWDDENYEFEPRPADWLEALGELKEGMTHTEVLTRVGAPTFMNLHTTMFFYDDLGCTHALRFEEGVVVEITRDREQRWVHSFEYEKALIG